MASDLEFVQYVMEQLRGIEGVTYRRMFGEYGVFCRGKFFAVICDNQLYVKITQEGREILKECMEIPPYQGANPYFFIENIDDTQALQRLVEATYQALPEPKPKTKRGKRNGKDRL